MRVAFMAGCGRPPAGWVCFRVIGHDGPCAARPACDRCGFGMDDHHCKLVCPECGFMRDCSDP